MHVPPLSAADVTELLAPAFNGYEQMATDDRDYLGRTVQALTDGRAVYVRAIGDAMAQLGGAADPISALAALLSPTARSTHWCRFCYELRLHRARGYGALKAILDILADEEPLTLTEISLRLRRTPGSTKDYLSWLEDVDLVTSRQKRYSFTDPLLRLWVRLHCRPTPPPTRKSRAKSSTTPLARVPQAGDPRPRSPTPASTRRRKSARAGASSKSTEAEVETGDSAKCVGAVAAEAYERTSSCSCFVTGCSERRHAVERTRGAARHVRRQRRLVQRAVHQRHPSIRAPRCRSRTACAACADADDRAPRCSAAARRNGRSESRAGAASAPGQIVLRVHRAEHVGSSGHLLRRTPRTSRAKPSSPIARYTAASSISRCLRT